MEVSLAGPAARD